MTVSRGAELPESGRDDGGIRRVAVLGAGTMGHGIAQVCAAAGTEVMLYDVEVDAVERAIDRVDANLRKGVDLGKVDSAERARVLAAIATTSSLSEAVLGADLVVEAVPESLDLKRSLMREVEAVARADAMLATNTSSLSVGQVASALERPERFVGLHFFNPVHVMRLVEVVLGPDTGDHVRDAAIDFVRRIGKEAIVVRDSPGFASSRLGVLLGLEAIRMVEDGVASPEDIDKAMELGYRHPMGPLRLTDLVGLDVRLEIAEYLHETLGSECFRPPELLRRMVAEGALGKKAGRGFYDWSDS